MRSTFGRARVTQTVRPSASRGRNAVGGDQRQTRLRPGQEPAFQHVGFAASVAQPGGNPLAELLALLADDDGRRAGQR